MIEGLSTRYTVDCNEGLPNQDQQLCTMPGGEPSLQPFPSPYPIHTYASRQLAPHSSN